MRNCILAFSTLLLAVLLGASPAFAQETTLGIKAPPTGSLSAEQLAAVAADIRRLENDPLASDAKQASENLFKWAIESPDVSLSICTGVIGGLSKSESTHHATLLVYFILSSAAYVIENPDHAEDKTKVNIGGLEGVINAYNVIKAQEGDAANDSFIEKLINMKKEEKLEAYVVKGLEKC